MTRSQDDAAGERRPAVRVASVRDILDYLDKFAPGTGSRVRARVPDDVLAIVDRAPRLSWIDVEDDVYVPTAIWAVLGDDEATEMMREFLMGHFETALLRPLLHTTRKLFGLSPMNVLRALPSGWPLVYRDVARLEVRALDSGSAEIELSEVAETVLGSGGYIQSFRAILLGLIDLTGYQGAVELADLDLPGRRVCYRLRWWRD